MFMEKRMITAKQRLVLINIIILSLVPLWSIAQDANIPVPMDANDISNELANDDSNELVGVIKVVGVKPHVPKKDSNEPEKVSITAEPNNTATPIPEPDVNNSEPNYTSTGDIFNSEFASILTEYVNEDGLVNYKKLKRQNLELKAILASLQILEPEVYESWTTNEQKAFWINTWNMKMLSIIIENYPVESSRMHRLWWPPSSIRHIPPKFEIGSAKWNGYKLIVMDEEFNLSSIENKYFRKKFADPRVFFALCSANADSPKLLNKPYFGNGLDKQLDEQVRKFLSTESGLQIDQEKKNVKLSVLFEKQMPWYGSEFKAKYGIDRKFKSHSETNRAVLNFITQYIEQSDKEYLETGNYTIKYKRYDWRLNEQ